MKVKEFKDKTEQELNDTLKNLKKEIDKTMDSIIKGKEKNLKKVRLLRKDVARVVTVIKEKSNA